MQSEGHHGAAEYFSQRNLHPRTGDCAAFSGRNSQQSMSSRSDFHDDAWTTGSSFLDTMDDEPALDNADVQLEGVTSDGGMALNVEFPDHEEEHFAHSTVHDDLLPNEKQAYSEEVALYASQMLLLPLNLTLMPSS